MTRSGPAASSPSRMLALGARLVSFEIFPTNSPLRKLHWPESVCALRWHCDLT
jgi:hypothetical protein